MKVSSVQYVKFEITEEQQEELLNEGTVIRIHIDHPAYQAQSVLSEESRKSIVEDLAA